MVQELSKFERELTVMLAEHEVPVAYSMNRLAMIINGRSPHPMQLFTCYWTAFNNIYVTLAEYNGETVKFKTNPDGSIKMRVTGPVSLPKVTTVSERKQIGLAFKQFSGDLKRRLVEHDSAKFFVYRTPHWRGKPVVQDADGQHLNGVLNVGHTVNSSHPVWEPIDTVAFEAYHKEAEDKSAQCDTLAMQIVNVLYAVRNNTFHGGKRVDDANDKEVLEKALPLLEMIVASFVKPQRTP